MLKSMHLPYSEIENDGMLSAISAAGFEGLDIGLAGIPVDRDESMRIAEALRGRLERHGLICAQVHLPEYGLFKSSEVVDEETTKRLINSFDVMKTLDCRWGAYHPRSSTNFDYDSRRAMADNLAQLPYLLEEAAKRDAGIAVENIPIFPGIKQYRFFTADCEDHLELIDRLGADNAGVCWDFGHAHLMSYDTAEMLLRFGERIKIVHVHDNFRRMDDHLVPFTGSIDWAKVMPALRQAGFSGPLSLEVKCPFPEAADTFYPYCFAAASVLEAKFG